MALTTNKKRKIDSEGRNFKNSWTDEYFVIEQTTGILCIICQETINICKEYNIKRHYSTKHADKFDGFAGQIRIDKVNALKQGIIGQQSFFKTVNQSSEGATRVSFLIAEALAKRGKPMSDGEFVKDCLAMFAAVACPDKKSFVEKISLSHQTIARRVDDLSLNIQDTLIQRLGECELFSLCLDESTDVRDTAQLAIFVRGVTKTFDVVEELLDLCPMKGTTTGKDIFDEVNKILRKFRLADSKLCGLTTDGAPAMTGRHNGFVSLMQKSLPQEVITCHCILHQEQLCAKSIPMPHIMEKVVSTVNFIRSRGLNHRQFQAFLAEVEADYGDVVYFSQVRWLSRATTLARFWSLRSEIKSFKSERGKDVTFLEDDVWLSDLAFLMDITKYLADLNIKLQGKDLLVNNMFENISAFMLKLNLLLNQMSQNKVVHFATLSTRPIEAVDHVKYFNLLTKLTEEFNNRFVDFKRHSDEMRIFGNPFAIDPSTAPDSIQLEIIDIQSQSDLKMAFSQNDLLTFYAKYVKADTFPNLVRFSLRYISLFGSSYCCEQLFSRMKNIKSKSRSLLADEHLTGILRIATSTVGADVDYLCKQRQCQTSH